MLSATLPLLIFGLVAIGTAVGMMAAGYLFGPRRNSAVKQMPYESGMDPIHDARRRFDVRFYLVAIAFLIFDVELLFLYPWAVASSARGPLDSATGEPAAAGIDWAVAQDFVSCRGLVFAAFVVFFALIALGLLYDIRRGVMNWK